MSVNQLATETDELPKGWTLLAMNDVGRWYGGGTPSKANPRFWTGGNIPWVSPKDMKFDVISDAQDHITEDAVVQSATNLVETGSVLIVVRSGILQHTLPVAVTQRQVALNQDLKAITPLENVRSDYLALALKAFEREILHTCTKTGTTVQSLALPVFLRFQVPIAPLPEQRRIVDEIEKQFTRLEAGVAALQRVQANLKRYRAAVLKAACEGQLVPTEAELQKPVGNDQKGFETGEQLLERILAERRQQWTGRGKYKEPAVTDTTDLPPLPDGWTWATLEQLCPRFADSAHRTPKYGETGLPALGPRDVVGGILNLDEARLVDDHEFSIQTARYIPQAGDVVYSRELSLGWGALVPEGRRLCLSQGMCVFRPHHDVNVRYFLALLNGPIGRKQAEDAATGSAHPHINLGDIKGYSFPLPALSEQTRIVAELERRLSVMEELESLVSINLKQSTRIRHSILQKAFSGSLVPQDPSEEPADKLFERLRVKWEQESDSRPLKGRKHSPSAGKKVSSMKASPNPKSALESALAQRPELLTASELFGAGHFEREQVHSFYDAIADSSEAIKRLSAGRQRPKVKAHLRRKLQKSQPPFRLHELWVKKFKNLDDYLVTFDQTHALDVLLGWNGTGKSNLFEVLIAIFRDLYKWQTKDSWTPQDGLEGYRVRYEIDGRLIEIDWDTDV